jgi:predicted dehydrogenase
MTQLGWGFLGTGNIARQFAGGMASAQRGSLIAVASRSADSAQSFASKFNISSGYGSYDAMLRDPNVQAVYVSLQNSMHHEWTIKCLRAGKHVLCEKPFARDASESEEMFDVAQREGRVLMEAFMYRSHPQTLGVLDAIRRGEIGDVKLMKLSFCYRTNKIDDNVRFSHELAGGALMDVGCYCINLARAVARCVAQPPSAVGDGSPAEGGCATYAEPSAVQAHAVMHESGVDEQLTATLQFPNDILATMSCGMRVQADNAAQICGTDGFIEIPWPWKPPAGKAGFTIARSTPPRQDNTKAAGPPPRQWFSTEADRDLYAMEADDFAEAVLDGKPPRISREDTLGNMHVLDQMRAQIGLRWH